MESMMGSRSRPFSVSWYSTRGGTSANVWRSTIPSSSSARRRSESVRGLMPASERSSSQKRDRPSERSRTSSRVHLPQTTSAVRQTGHVGSPATPNTLPTEARCSAAGLRVGRGVRPLALVPGHDLAGLESVHRPRGEELAELGLHVLVDLDLVAHDAA